MKDVDFPVTKNAAQTKRKTDGLAHAFVAKVEGKTFETKPTVIYATYLGGSSSDVGYAIAVDDAENAWVTGSTTSADFPITGKPYQEKLAYAGGLPSVDAFITKINSTGSEFLYSTFLGGQQEDTGLAISVDDKGNVYATGFADYAIVDNYYNGKPYQNKFKVSENAFQKQFGGGANAAFIIKLTNDGTVVYCTYLGGKIADSGTAISCDKEGNAYVSGKTFGDFIVTEGAFNPSFPGGNQSIFVTKMSSDGSKLLYSTYLGGSSTDEVKFIRLDNNNNLYLVGNTTSCDFNVTNGAYETKYFAGNGDGFLSKLNEDGNKLIYSTYIGGSKKDSCDSFYLGNTGIAYISGVTSSKDFFVTEDAFCKTNPSKNNDGFIIELSLKVAEEKEIDMPDIDLKKTLNEMLGRDGNHKITNNDMEKLPIEINLSSKSIENLKGLEYAVYVRSLNIDNNKIRTTMPLLNLV
ncbi:SBBP repeat-containing protein [Clostridium estertheticum]|uniref:SBBP repeat-containing protein n=1 Tax=Clostridium estertheticum TaxID=238834 RepID=UPI0013EEB2F7|nr:SBBP repeat-containing protein [Clostridium estertheticum]MBZ9606997.1 SBBP repeat-containing protein [Clostridium estertheticum]